MVELKDSVQKRQLMGFEAGALLLRFFLVVVVVVVITADAVAAEWRVAVTPSWADVSWLERVGKAEGVGGFLSSTRFRVFSLSPLSSDSMADFSRLAAFLTTVAVALFPVPIFSQSDFSAVISNALGIAMTA